MNHLTEVTDALSDRDLEAIKCCLRDYNRSANPLWWSKFIDPAHDDHSLQIVVRNQAHQWLGGLLATTSMKWLKISIMAVQKEHRGQGIGKSLVNAAESEAIRRGCHYSFVDTMEFQSPAFYAKCGYDEVGRLPDWDSHGHAKFFMTKQLAS